MIPLSQSLLLLLPPPPFSMKRVSATPLALPLLFHEPLDPTL